MMRKIILNTLLIAVVFFTQISWVFAQSVTINPTPATCPGQGAATVTTTGITNPFFQLKDGSGTNIGSGSSTGSFLALDAGVYQVQVTGEGGYSSIHPFAIDDDYTPIPTPTIAITGLCDNTFTIGGTLSINIPAVSGKTYQYKVVKTTNASFPDTEGTYIPISTTTGITEFGTYQVRIQDECGQTITIQRDVEPSLTEIKGIYFSMLNNQPCGSNTVEMGSIQFFSTSDGGGNLNFASYLAAGGVKLEMWERPAGAPCPDTPPAGTPVFSEIITQVSGPTGYILPLVSTGRYIVRVTTPCGQSNVFCYSRVDAITPRMVITSSNAGCGVSETMSIYGVENIFLNFPVSVTVTDSSNNVVYSDSKLSSWYLDRWEASGLPFDDYTVTYTDNCGVVLTETVSNPLSGTPAPPGISDIQYTKWKCFDDNSGSLIQTGTTQVTITIDGYIKNRQNVSVVITSGPSNVGVPGTLYSNSHYAWTNMLPGNYTISVDSGCLGETPIELSFVVAPGSDQILQQSIESTGTSFCTGGGSISSTVVYTGNFFNVVQLLDDAGNVLDENTTGDFTNLPPGTYHTRLHIGTCTADTYYITNSNPIIITDGDAGPQIIKKVGVVCEDASGMPTSEGAAYFEIAGASPVMVEYKLQSASIWEVFSTDADATFEIDGLTPNEIYEVRITSCGNSVSTTVSIQTPGVLTANNTVHPCVGEPYTLSAPEYAGATYEWTNSSGAVVATTREYHIANYNASYDGTYTAKITWGDCVVRFISLDLDSQMCGEPIDPYPCTDSGITSVDLNDVFDEADTPHVDVVLEWWTTPNREAGTQVADPANVTVSGTYYAFFYDTVNDCYNTDNSTAAVVVQISQPCEYDHCVTGDCNTNAFLNTGDPNTLEYDNFISGFHSSIIKQNNGSYLIWGQGAKPDAFGEHLYEPTEITPANGFNYTGDILKATLGTRGASNDGSDQYAILTTDGLYIWGGGDPHAGRKDVMVHRSVKDSETFDKMTSANIPNANTYGLPDTVTPDQVKMLFGSFGTLAITTCTGEVYVLSWAGAKNGDGTPDDAANQNIWHRVMKNASTPLNGVVATRGTIGALMALTHSGEIYTWGSNTYLGDGSDKEDRSYATKMTLPTGVTPKMIGMTKASPISLAQPILNGYYLLSTSGEVYSLGDNSKRQLGTFDNVEQKSWVNVKSTDAATNLTDIVWISPNEHDGNGYATVTALTSDGKLWGWGMNDANMLGTGGNSAVDPRYMFGGLDPNDKILAIETGGHINTIFKDCDYKLGYIGHSMNGSYAKFDSLGSTYSAVFKFDGAKMSNLCSIDLPAYPEVIDLEVCEGLTADLADALQNTVPVDYTLQWWTTQNRVAGTQVADPANVPAGTYYTFFVSNDHDCPNLAGEEVIVAENPAPVVPQDVANIKTFVNNNFEFTMTISGYDSYTWEYATAAVPADTDWNTLDNTTYSGVIILDDTTFRISHATKAIDGLWIRLKAVSDKGCESYSNEVLIEVGAGGMITNPMLPSKARR